MTSTSITVLYVFDDQPHTVRWRWNDEGTSTKQVDDGDAEPGESVETALETIQSLKQAGAIFIMRY